MLIDLWTVNVQSLLPMSEAPSRSTETHAHALIEKQITLQDRQTPEPE